MDSRLLTLKWNNHQKTFFKNVSKFRHKHHFTDVTLACDRNFYQVHKIVLSSSSEYFEDMFENTHFKCDVVVLKGIKSSYIEALLNYMYVGEVEVKQEDLPELIEAAEFLKVKGLATADDEEVADEKKEAKCSKKRKINSNSPKDEQFIENNKKLMKSDDSVKQSTESNSDTVANIELVKEDICKQEIKIEPFEEDNNIVLIPDESESEALNEQSFSENNQFSENYANSGEYFPELNLGESDNLENIAEPSGEGTSENMNGLRPDNLFFASLDEHGKIFKCSCCSYSTRHKSHIKRHCLVHSGEKPYECNRCNFRTRQKIRLIEHRRTHTGERPYACSYCDYRSSYRTSLKRHILCKH